MTSKVTRNASSSGKYGESVAEGTRFVVDEADYSGSLKTGSRGRCDVTIGCGDVCRALAWSYAVEQVRVSARSFRSRLPRAAKVRPQFIGNRCLSIRSNRWLLTSCPECAPGRVSADKMRAVCVSMGRPRNAQHTVRQTRSLERFTPRHRRTKPSGSPLLGLSRHIPARTGMLSLS
ncbi:hypothetical protein MRX96_030054 [Rhipicephalus microplus]